MKLFNYLMFFCFFGCCFGASKPTKIPIVKALDFMKRYGYIQDDGGQSEALYTEQGLSDNIKLVQRYGGIEETGVFDEATKKLMTARRCGVPDIIKHNRKRRYVFGTQSWQKRNISYFLSNWSPKLGEVAVHKNIQKALDLWGGYGSLSFYRKYTPDADIIVLFGSGHHGDNNPFDGTGGILAHAFFPHEEDPLGGDIHFDEDEQWVDTNDPEKTDFYAVALHELGHSLGLAHSPVQNSIMFPYYQSPEGGIQLGYDDILAMYDLYIRRQLKEDLNKVYTDINNNPSTRKMSTERTTTLGEEEDSTRYLTTERSWYPTYKENSDSGVGEDKTVLYENDDETVDTHKEHDDKHHIPTHNSPSFPDICDGHLDAVATLRDELFVFRDQYVWRFKEKGQLVDGYPVKLRDVFQKLPDYIKKIDAAYQRADGMIVLFTGNVFWVYDGERVLNRSPEPLTNYGLPEYVNQLDAVQNWNRNRKTYFYTNDRFWRYNEITKRMDPDYPQSMERWRGVPSYLDAATTWRGVTYFFRGGLFWKFDNTWIMVTEESPLPTPTIWFGCSESNNTIMKWFSTDP